MSKKKETAAIAAQNREEMIDKIMSRFFSREELEVGKKRDAEIAAKPAEEIVESLRNAMGLIGNSATYMSQSDCDVIHDLGTALQPLWQACRISYQVLEAYEKGDCAADEAYRNIGIVAYSVSGSAKRYERLRKRLVEEFSGDGNGKSRECLG